MSDFAQLVDLASERFGGLVLTANDEFFAPAENLFKVSKPIDGEDRYTERGKWMDGWETRRRRTPGYDWCLIRLGLPGVVRGVAVDTRFFRGNFPSHCSLDACAIEGSPSADRLLANDAPWREILSKSEVLGDTRNLFAVSDTYRCTHLRFNIFPDGGVARLRVHGEVLPDWRQLLASGGELDLGAVAHGGRPLERSDMFFSSPFNLLMPGPAVNMGDGWETKRRRGPGHDWVVIQLGIAGEIHRLEVDTTHFKGNYPESCSLEACSASGACDLASLPWTEILPRMPLQPDRRHNFETELRRVPSATHVRFNIFPDGGISRLRIFGQPDAAAVQAAHLQWLNLLAPREAVGALQDFCGSSNWVQHMVASRPYASLQQLYAAANEGFARLNNGDWLEAIQHHPRLGAKQAAASQSLKAQTWSAQEQSCMGASVEDRARFQKASRAYEARFGHIFLLCASGKSSGEMLALLEARMSNSPEKELRVAAEEQRKITRLRLEKLLAI